MLAHQSARQLASADYIAHAIGLARQYDFLLVMDECYIDIWRGEKPVSALEVAMEMAPVRMIRSIILLC